MLDTAIKTWTVSELNQQAGHCLEHHFSLVQVIGEISNISCPSSGHWYFSLKDQQAQIRCAFFKTRQRGQLPPPRNGDQVSLLARVSVYAPRGDYQLIVQQLTPHGEGRLHIEFAALKKKLQAKGWFDDEHKKTIPTFPKQIGIIASPTSAALQDIIHVTQRRFPTIPLLIYPCTVQGDQAAASICHAIQLADQQSTVDVLVIARGGGSIEDLWPFNEEIVAEQIFNCQVPIVSGVGHDIDHTITDFVADVRAATPSAAAELVTPDRAHCTNQLRHLRQQLDANMTTIITRCRTQLLQLQQRLPNPKQQHQQQRDSLVQLTQQLQRAIERQMQHHYQTLDHYHTRLRVQDPSAKLSATAQQLQTYQQRLQHLLHKHLRDKNNQLHHLSRTLHAHSPLKTLEKGYAIVQHENQTITSSQAVKSGDQLDITLQHGQIECIVAATKD